MNLLIDIGNSKAKIAIAGADGIRFLCSISKPVLEDFETILLENAEADGGILVSSGPCPKGLPDLLKTRFSRFLELTHKTPVPMEVVYDTKETLGMDRISAAIGAVSIQPGKDLLVISAGTAITFDLVTREGKFLGGNISPGIEMRFRALHQFTDKLPMVSKNSAFPLLGSSTQQALLSGVMNGVLFELEGYIHSLQQQYAQLTTLLTGGDAIFLSTLLKSDHIIDLNLNFTGLNRILEYNC